MTKVAEEQALEQQLDGLRQSVEVTIGFARDALKGGMLINGGAVVAILAMVGRGAERWARAGGGVS